MHRVAENGIAAHWQYKEGHLAKPEEVAKVARLKEIFSVAREIEDPDEFMEVVKIDLFSQDVYVFTPNGDVREFPKGATALDFAYQIHSEVGNTCVGAKVGGQMVPLRYEMKSGDTIEILTSKNQHPRRAWLDMVKTGRAVSRIRQYLRREEHETGRRIGKEMLESELKRRGTSISALVKKGVLKAWMKENSMKEVETLFLQIAQGHLGLVATVRELLPDQEEPGVPDAPPEGAFGRMMDRLRKRNRSSPVLVSGEDGVLINYANCCNPLPGEPIAGFVTRGRGITVHRRTCRQLLSMDVNRRIPVAWTSEDEGERSSHIGNIQIICVDRPGLLANVSTMCTDLKVNIAKVTARSLGDDKGEVDLQVVVSDVSELSGLIRRLEKIKGVITVNRVGAGGA
jgi:GTP pyrophosphokinase